MKVNKYNEEDKIIEYSPGINKKWKVKKFVRVVTISFDLSTKKGKAIGQLLDGIRRLL